MGLRPRDQSVWYVNQVFVDKGEIELLILPCIDAGRKKDLIPKIQDQGRMRELLEQRGRTPLEQTALDQYKSITGEREICTTENPDKYKVGQIFDEIPQDLALD